ncbi:hypothetical protein AX16_004778 [Volvariella volvacea WC 439]|nr:hypothetical protein AX16_004778 [Volvariella volvacea WC 439]
MADPVKILTVGSAVGSISSLFSKIRAIDAKHGKFDLVLCTGDFFGPPKELDTTTEEDETSQLLSGKLEAPVECYIMQGEYPLPHAVVEKFSKTGGELCKNVFLLTKSGIVTTAQGLRIACLGGVYDENVHDSSEAAPGFSSPFFTSQTIERLLGNTLVKKSGAGSGSYGSLASIQSSASSSQVVDILITNTWPASITHFSSAPIPDSSVKAGNCHPLDYVIQKVKPRYHFAAGGRPPVYWEREPYTWEDGESVRVSRFIGLGAFGAETNGKKQRWFYAFSIAPDSPASMQKRPPNATQNPFKELQHHPAKRLNEDSGQGENYIFGNVRQPKRTRIERSEPGKPPPGYKCHRCQSSEHFIDACPERTKPPEGYICRLCNIPGHLVRDCPTRHAVGDTGGRKPRPGYVCRACGSEAHYIDDCPVANQNHARHHGAGRSGNRTVVKEISTDECWFCLSNPNLAKHLIVSIGSECYLTLPKGQMIPTKSSQQPTQIPGGGHVLIVPITHYPAYNVIPSDLAPPIVDESEGYKSALKAMYARYNSTVVFFEVARVVAKGGHAHIQAIPIPLALQDRVEEAFRSQGSNQGIDFEADPATALTGCADGSGGYFRVELPDGKQMVHILKPHIPFSIQFGRQVLASVLEMPDRMDWKACALSDADEAADAQAFKSAFTPFDPSMA